MLYSCCLALELISEEVPNIQDLFLDSFAFEKRV